MPDPFINPRGKLARAKEHISDLVGKIDAFQKEEPYARVLEPHPNVAGHVIFKLKLTRELPSNLCHIASDVATNLRDALDHAVNAVAILFGNRSPREAYFPISGSVSHFENALNGRKQIPQEIHALLRSFQPYKGGNALLYTLNLICNVNKHSMFIPVGVACMRRSASFRATGYMSVPTNPVWDSTKNEIIIATVAVGTDFDYDVDFGFYVAFNEVEGVHGQEALRILEALAREVERVLLAIEAEARRLLPNLFI